MYAVVEDRGKQFKVKTGEEILVERLDSPPGTSMDFGRVLLLCTSARGTLVGAPVVEGARVEVRVLGAEKGPKHVHFKLRRRKNSRTKRGHRQGFTRLRVSKIHAPA